MKSYLGQVLAKIGIEQIAFIPLLAIVFTTFSHSQVSEVDLPRSATPVLAQVTLWAYPTSSFMNRYRVGMLTFNYIHNIPKVFHFSILYKMNFVYSFFFSAPSMNLFSFLHVKHQSTYSCFLKIILKIV